MQQPSSFLQEGENLEKTYQKISNEVKNSVSLSAEQFNAFTHSMLMQPAEWFKALAVLELAVEKGYDTELTNTFFKRIFAGYDCKASVDLNNEDYKFFWEKIHALFTTMTPFFPEAVIEQALQYFNPRRGYADQAKTMQLLQEAAEKENESAQVLYGYYLIMGFCGTRDTEKGLEWMNKVKSEFYKQKAVFYKIHSTLPRPVRRSKRTTRRTVLCRHSPIVAKNGKRAKGCIPGIGKKIRRSRRML